MDSGPSRRRRTAMRIVAKQADPRSVVAAVTGTAPRPRWNRAAMARSVTVPEPMAVDARSSICVSPSFAVRPMAATVSRAAMADTAVAQPQAMAVRAADTVVGAAWVAVAAAADTLAVEVVVDTPAAAAVVTRVVEEATAAIASRDTGGLEIVNEVLVNELQ